MWPALELVLRTIFCFPKPTGNTERSLMSPGEARIYKTLTSVGHALAFAEFINFLFDFVIVIKLAREGQGSAALALMGGMVLAWIVSYLGHVRLVGRNNGVLWAPMFQSPTKYYRDMPKLESPMRVIYCLAFTEMAAFFFEDAIFVSSFLQQGTLMKMPDSFEQFNLVWTFCRAVIAGTVMVLAMILTVNIKCLTCSSSNNDKGDEQEKRSSRLCLVLKALVFLAIWAWLATVWIVTMSDITFIFAENIIDDATSKIPVPLWGDVIIYWTGGLYFSLPLLFGQRRHAASDGDEPDTPRTVDDSSKERSFTVTVNSKQSFKENELEEDGHVGGVEV